MNNEKKFEDTDGIRFNEEEKEYIRDTIHKENEIYLHSIKLALKDLRAGISEDVAEVISPITEKFFGITDEVKKSIHRLETWMWILGLVTVAVIMAIIFIHT
jgi:hypothetical protein